MDGYGSWCLLCTNTLTKAWRARHKNPASGVKWHAEHRAEFLGYLRRRGAEGRTFIDSLKTGKSCVDCGELFLPFCMDFDHVRGIKLWDISVMRSHRREAILEEVTKCELVCAVCHRVRTQARQPEALSDDRLSMFREWLNTLKSEPCTDCGRVRPPVAMDFDHVRGEKVKGVSQMWSRGRDKVLIELAKCELVCCICHRIRTQNRRMPQKEAA